MKRGILFGLVIGMYRPAAATTTEGLMDQTATSLSVANYLTSKSWDKKLQLRERDCCYGGLSIGFKVERKGTGPSNEEALEVSLFPPVKGVWRQMKVGSGPRKQQSL